jgi:hypothetical protein
VKTNQLQRIIRTGRTGHWLNHGKEHCLVSTFSWSPKIRLAVISFLRCSCSLVPQSITPFLHSTFGWCLLPNVHLFKVPRTTSLVWFFLTTCTLHRATPARWVVFWLMAELASTISLGLFFQLLAVLCGQIPAPVPLP